MEDIFNQNNSIVFLHETRVRSQIIYSITILATLISLSVLPFIYTTVSVKGSGSIQSNIEKTELLAPIGGRIVQINLRDNQKIEKGKILLNIDAESPIQQNKVLGRRTKELNLQIMDALTLLKFSSDISTSVPILQTGLYAASWQQYNEQTHNSFNACDQALRVYKRYETLFTQKAVTLSEYEQYKFNYDQALSDFKLVSKKFKIQWQTEINQYRSELRELQKQRIELDDREKLYVLKAPISGSLQNLTGLQLGSVVTSGQKLGDISPDSALLAFCYIKPADIGLIKKGQDVRFQIDAFNYNQWGILKGTVMDVSDDIVILNQSPVFKVKCRLDKNYLSLRNGYKGHIKKGMTFNAHFSITRRSLYNLLYDKVDDWLNPNTPNQS